MSLERLYNLDRWSVKFSGQLDKLLHDKKYVDGFQKLPGGELVELTNYLDRVRHLWCNGISLITPTDPRSPRFHK